MTKSSLEEMRWEEKKAIYSMMSMETVRKKQEKECLMSMCLKVRWNVEWTKIESSVIAINRWLNQRGQLLNCLFAWVKLNSFPNIWKSDDFSKERKRKIRKSSDLQIEFIQANFFAAIQQFAFLQYLHSLMLLVCFFYPTTQSESIKKSFL